MKVPWTGPLFSLPLWQAICGTDPCVLVCTKNATDSLFSRKMSCIGAPPPFSDVAPDDYPTPCDAELVTHYVGDLHQPLHVDRDRGDRVS
jgi:hypothetical protein